MQPASNLGHLKTADWESVQDLVTRFEDACQGGEIAKLEQFLLPEGNPMRVLALNELIKSDLEIRWSRRKRILLEDYLKRFRELQAHPNYWPKLLYEEYRVRLKFGDKPVLADYQRRFPEQFGALEKIVSERTLPPKPAPAARTPVAEDPGTATVAHMPGTAPVPPTKPEPTSSAEPATKAPERQPAPAEAAAKAAGRAPPDVGNGYKLISPLGSGTFGQVWRAEAPGGVPSAVKIIFRPIDHEEAKRELDSLEKIKALRHPFLTATTAFWQAGDKLCIAMELADGSLRDRAKECRAAGMAGVPVPELLGYFKEAAEALDYLHEQDLLHRDIKPDNLLLVKPAARLEASQDRVPRAAAGGVRSHLKLGDFGLVRLFESQRMQASGAGTPAYMPPEVWNGQISKHSDQYSLAITYAELRRGKPAFAGTNMYELMVEALSKDPDLTGLETGEQEVLRKALDKKPDQRYESCWEFAHALEQAFMPPAPQVVVPPSSGQTPDPGATWDGPDVGTIVPRTVADSKSSRPSWRQDTEPHVGVQTEAPPRRNWLTTLLLGLVACGLVGFLVYQIIPRPVVVPVIPGVEPKEPPSFRLQVLPLSVPVTAGGEVRLSIIVDRHDFKEAVKVIFEGVPHDVTLANLSFPGNQESSEVVVNTKYEAPAGTWSVKAIAEGGGQTKVADFKIVITPADIFRPVGEGWVKADDAILTKDANGRLFYDKLDLVRSGMHIRFLLIPLRPFPLDQTARISSFYVMENKVSFAQFQQFANSNPKIPLKGMKWKEEDGVGGGYPKPNYPVFNVLVDDAYQFARWLAGPTGNLPKTEQWDKAAGRFEDKPGEGPFIEPWNKKDPKQIAVGRSLDDGPMECGQATHDKTRFGCRDMAGNGREWTRTMLLPPGQYVPLLNPGESDLVVLRGHPPNAEEPFRFKDLAVEDSPNQCGYLRTSPNIGFRVVLEAN